MRLFRLNFLKTWLLSLVFLIFVIVIVGGLTRLTGSGLSMVDWNLFMGSIPPIGDAAWVSVFNGYKNYPEYIQVNSSMTLDEFKVIFLWEYIHRMLGRLIGLVIMFGLIYMILNSKKYKSFISNGVIMFILVCSQGLMGWYMVKSGLIDIPRVSHFRLASHLFLALLLFEYIVWTYLSINKKKFYFSNISIAMIGWISLLVLQIIYGAFTSGLKAGWGYNTYPLMNGEFLPSAAFMHDGLFNNLFFNPVMVQFFHRHFPVFLSLAFFCIAYYIFKSTKNKQIRVATLVTLIILILQILLGILTLVLVIPIALASLHQITGVVLLTSSVVLLFYLLNNFKLTMKN